MAIIPTRNLRTSILDQLGLKYDKDNLNSALADADRRRTVIENQQQLMDELQRQANTGKRYSLEDMLANEKFKKMLDDIASTRVGFAMHPEYNGYGYAYDPEKGAWGGAPFEYVQEGGELAGAPWYRTAREAVRAIYDDALRGDHGENLAGFGIDDLYSTMNRLVDERAQAMLAGAEDPDALMAKLTEGNIYDKEGQLIPFKDPSVPFQIASFVLPMRTLGGIKKLGGDPEISARRTGTELAQALGGDALETIGSAFNPAGKLLGFAVNKGAKAMAKAGSKIPSLVKASDKALDIYHKPWVKLSAEGGIGNLANYEGIHAYDNVTDPTNTTQGGEANNAGRGIALAAGALPGVAGGLLGNFNSMKGIAATTLLSPKEKARIIVGESLGQNPGKVDKRLVNELLAKGATWEDYLKAPFRDITNEGYPLAGIAKVPRAPKELMTGDVDNVIADLKDVFPQSRHSAIDDFFDKNQGEVKDLTGGKYPYYARDLANMPQTHTESWDAFGVSSGDSPQFYKSQFKVPLKKGETIEGLSKDEIEKRMQRGDRLSKEYATRRQIHDKSTGSKDVDWDSPIWKGKNYIVKDGQNINPGSALVRRALLGLTREFGIGDPHNALDPHIEQVRSRYRVPTKNKETK